MMRALWTAATGMAAQTTNVDVISNNLANVNTAGFKRGRANFEDLMYQQVKTPGSESSATGTQVPSGIQIGLGVQTSSVTSIFSAGSLKQTDNPLDLAIKGRGFFEVLTANGDLAYTRGGAFNTDFQGQLVTANGDILQPGIVIPPDVLSINIAEDGTVSVDQQGAQTSVIGQLTTVDFSNAGGLKLLGSSLYLPTISSGAAISGTPGLNGFGYIGQGMLEMSNVNIVEEMVNLIAGQRAYEMNSKAIQAADEMLQAANNVKR